MVFAKYPTINKPSISILTLNTQQYAIIVHLLRVGDRHVHVSQKCITNCWLFSVSMAAASVKVVVNKYHNMAAHLNISIH